MEEFNTYKKVGYVPGAKEAIVLIELDRYDYITNDIIKKVVEVV